MFMYSCNIPRKHNITLDTTGRQRMLPRENLVETEFSEKVADSEFEGEKTGGSGGREWDTNVLAPSCSLLLFPARTQKCSSNERLTILFALPHSCLDG